MTLTLAADFGCQLASLHYHIPQFLIDMFVETCQGALISCGVGATFTGIKLVNRYLDKRDDVKAIEVKKD